MNEPVLAADEAALERVVGAATLARGRQYARVGAVLDVQWDAKAARVFGQVQGSARLPYTAMALLSQAPDGSLITFVGSCTCPVGADCKHAVALVLAARAQAPPVEPDPDPMQQWEQSLAAVVRAPRGGSEHSVTTVGLQFELTLPVPAERRLPSHPSKAPRGGVAMPARITLRPVLPGQKDNWVRTGIAWSNLSFVRPGPCEEHRRLLNELVAIHSVRRSYSAYGEATLHLEAIESRRLWDILREAQATGLPLVQAGRGAPPVWLSDEPAELVVDLTRSPDGMTLAPRVNAGAEQLVLDASLLIGTPAHGIAWWQAVGESSGHPRDRVLRLAPLAETVDAQLRGLAGLGPVHIPTADVSRFMRDFYPRLRQRVTLTSPDGSIELPTPLPPRLRVVVQHGDAHRLGVAWSWAYQVGEAAGREPLWAVPGSTSMRDDAGERAVLEPVVAVAKAMPELFDETVRGPRLAADRSFAGFTSARFCTEVLPRLRELPDLEIEEIGAAVAYRAAVDAPIISVSGATAEDDRDWFNLAVTIIVDGEDVPFNQLFVAIAADQPHLVLPSGTYFSLDRPEFGELAALVAEARVLQDRASSDGVRVNRFQASLWADLERIAVVTGQASVWQQTVRALGSLDDLAEQPQPAGLHATLRPYQSVGYNWLTFLYDHGLGGVLADEMGLGKTLQTVALIARAKEQGTNADRPFLVVAPTSVVFNWVSECRRFAPGLIVAMVTETQRRRGVGLSELAQGADIVVTSYTLFRLEYDQYAGIDWAGLVMDEAQFVKNHKSLAHEFLKKLPAPFKLAITGTPMENNLMELWSILSITAPGLFANQKRFEDYYRNPIEKYHDADRLAQLRRRIRPLLLRRTKREVATDLPDKQEQVIELELNPRHRRVYQTYLQRERQKVLGLLGDLDKNRFEILRSLTLLRQASLDVGLIDPEYAKVPSTKLDALMEQLEDVVSEGHRTLVFSQFTRFLAAARDRLDVAGIEYCYLDGRTKDRPAVLESFKSGTAPVFLISLKAGGFGLNLTEADYCILLDPWWNPATEAQAIDRTHRIGQTKKVMVYRLVAKDTIEEKVMALKAGKAELFNSVMDDGAFSAGTLTAADIRELLE